MNKIQALVQKYPWLKYILAYAVGVAMGAFFYPTRQIKETMQQQFQQEMQTTQQESAKELATVNDKYASTLREYASYREDTEKELTKLNVTVMQLQDRKRTYDYKIVKPDGTVIEQHYTEDDVNEANQVIQQTQEEYKQQVTSITQTLKDQYSSTISSMQKDFDSKTQTYQAEIASLKSTKSETIGQKQFGIELGETSARATYLHGTFDLLGPIMLGLHGSVGSETQVGAGIGFRF